MNYDKSRDYKQTHDYGGTLSRDPYSKASTGMRKACRLVRLNETFENESAHSQVLRKVSAGARSRSPPRPLGRVKAHFRVKAFR